MNRTPANFHDLWTAHAGSVRRFAIGLTGNSAIADDLTAEAFTRLWSGWDGVRLPTVRAYLYTIVRNLYLQQSRRHRREGLLPEDVPQHASLETQIADREALAHVNRRLLELPEQDRAALLLRAVEGLPYEEIAVMLQLSTANVRVRVHRAYAAGEASPETVALLERELPRYPDLRQQLETMRDFTPAVAAAPPDTHELEAVAATSGLLSRRSWSLAVAICTSFLPSSVVVQSSKLTFQMARDQPAVAAVSVVIAYSAWLVYFNASRRLAATGLQGAAKLRQRLFWIAMGSGLGSQIALILGQQIGHAWWHAVFPIATATLFFHQSRPE